MSLGHILFCPGSSHLGYKQGGKKKGAREQGIGRRKGHSCAEPNSVPPPVRGVHGGDFTDQTAVGHVYLMCAHV